MTFPEWPHWYILGEDGQTPIRSTVEQCALWLSTNHHKKILEKTRVGNVETSTVFLGLDHSMSMAPGKPVLWETMIFGSDCSDDEQYQERYTSYKDAKLGHKRAVWRVRGEKPKNVEAS